MERNSNKIIVCLFCGVFVITLIMLIGYLCYSVWSIMYKEIFLYLLLYIVLVYGFYKSFIVLRRKLYSLPNKEIIEIEVIKEVPVEVPVIKVVQNIDATIHSYKLNERSIFYSERNILVVDGVEKKIQPQTCRILELFLEDLLERNIDVIDLNSDNLDIFIKIDILNDGKSIYTTDNNKFLEKFIEKVDWYYRENEYYFKCRRRELLS